MVLGNGFIISARNGLGAHDVKTRKDNRHKHTVLGDHNHVGPCYHKILIAPDDDLLNSADKTTESYADLICSTAATASDKH